MYVRALHLHCAYLGSRVVLLRLTLPTVYQAFLVRGKTFLGKNELALLQRFFRRSGVLTLVDHLHAADFENFVKTRGWHRLTSSFRNHTGKIQHTFVPVTQPARENVHRREAKDVEGSMILEANNPTLTHVDEYLQQ